MFHDAWHWQQWYTIVIYIIGLVLLTNALVWTEDRAKRLTVVFTLFLATFLQIVLFTGGWY